MVERSTCRFCDEVVAADLSKCPHCGEPLPARAVLQWKRLEVVVVAPGEMPIGVCFACARSRPTHLLRRQEPGGSRTIEVPTCAVCARRTAAVPLVLVGGVSLATGLAMCLLTSFRFQRDAAFAAAVGVAVLLVVAVGVVTYALRFRRVSVRWDPEVALVVPDALALRLAVERDAL